MRNIITLSQELKYLRDLPQANISFQEQNGKFLQFTIILVRIVNNESEPLERISAKLPEHIQFSLERISHVGVLRKKYHKEASIFSLEIENSLFLRKNHSVDLLRARNYVVKVLEKMIGKFRDYNGGFLFKQNERLEAIKSDLGSKGVQYEFLLENLFYSITPSIMQASMPQLGGKLLFDLFLEAIEAELTKSDECLLKVASAENLHAFVIKAMQPEILTRVSEEVQKIPFKKLEVASGLIEVQHHDYLCYLLLSPHNEQLERFKQVLKKTIDSWENEQKCLQFLRLHLPQPAKSLDPRVGYDRTSGIVIKMLYEGLMRLAENGKLEMAIAESVDISPDGRRYTFTLRKSFWSNGAPVTAFDFEYAWKRSINPHFHSPYSFLFYNIKNAQEAKRGFVPINEVGITAPDEKTFIVDIVDPAHYFLELTSNWAFSPLSYEIDQKHPGWAYHSGDTYICNGPFKLDYWKLNDDLQMIKNPLYWDAASVKLSKLTISIVEDQNIALEMFLRGQLDWLGDPFSKIPLHSVAKLKEENRIISAPLSGFFWMQLNIEALPFLSPKMRQAFAFAIDRQGIIDRLLTSEDLPAQGFYYNPFNKPESRFQDGNKQEALILFEESLKESGLKRSDLPTILISHSDIEEQETISREVGRQWKDLFGIKVGFERHQWNRYFKILASGDYMAGGLVWFPRYEDPIYYFNLFTEREGGLSLTKWKNPEYVALLNEAKKNTNLETKKEILLQCESLLVEAMPVIPLFFQKFRYLKNPRLKNVILSNPNQIDFRVAYLE